MWYYDVRNTVGQGTGHRSHGIYWKDDIREKRERTNGCLLQKVKRYLKRIYIDGCRYNERLNSKTGDLEDWNVGHTPTKCPK